MAKNRSEKDEVEGFEDAVYLSDLDHDETANGISKNEIISILYNYMVLPYIEKFTERKKVDVKAAEAMKALEIITKLKGFDKESTEDLPDEIELKL
jgi:hypothetical protein